MLKKLNGVQIQIRMRFKLSLLILVLPPLFSIAQNKDLELWGSMKFSKKLTKKIRFELEEQIRWADSLSQYKKNFTNLGVKYKVHKKHFFHDGYARLFDCSRKPFRVSYGCNRHHPSFRSHYFIAVFNMLGGPN